MTVSFQPFSQGSGAGRPATCGTDLGRRRLSSFDEDRLAVDDLEEHFVDVHGWASAVAL